MQPTQKAARMKCPLCSNRTFELKDKMDIQIKISMIAAGSALAGVIISQIFSLLISFLDKRHKKQILIRQKYEEMMFNFQDSLSYYSDIANCKTREQLYSKSHSIPAQRAMGIAMIYFPNIAPNIEVYLKYLVEYYNVIITSFDPNIPANAGGQARVNNKKQIEEIEHRLFLVKNDIIQTIEKNVRKYTKA